MLSCPDPIKCTLSYRPLVVNFAGSMTFKTGCQSKAWPHDGLLDLRNLGRVEQSVGGVW